MTSISAFRRTENRCEATLKERRKGVTKTDSWRCQLVKGHTGQHETHSGHRRWVGGDGVTWNAKGVAS